MKSRHGFVSNSSSSSFVVERVGDLWKKTPKILLTEDQENLLEEFGFNCDTKNDEEFPYRVWKYDIICNQDDAIAFLVENKITFQATIHYGHYTYIYSPENDKLFIFTNYGEIAGMYHSTTPEEYLERWKTDVPVSVYVASEWVKKNCY